MTLPHETADSVNINKIGQDRALRLETSFPVAKLSAPIQRRADLGFLKVK